MKCCPEDMMRTRETEYERVTETGRKIQAF